ncbi:MAG: DUF1858 domain-containing protein [Melioribacteraceae bacterium]
MGNNKPQITPETKVGELLDNYPELEEKLIEIAPPFRRLKNKVLRRTVAKITTLKQAAKVGNVSLSELVNKLRNAAGQIEIEIDDEKSVIVAKHEWVKDENIKIIYNASIDLDSGQQPITKVTKEINELNEDDIYLLITPFLPAPLIKLIEAKGCITYSATINKNHVQTFIRKQ